jgi:hypothetical protein
MAGMASGSSMIPNRKYTILPFRPLSIRKDTYFIGT